MKLAKNREAGQIFVWALILLAIGPLLVVPMLRLSSGSQRYNQVTEIYTLNAYAADAGIEYGKYQIFNNAPQILASPLNDNLTIGSMDVNVNVEYNPSKAAYDLVSTAATVQRSVTIEASIVIDVGLFGNVVASDGDLVIDNCDFESLEETGEADVYTHGNIEIKGSSYIDGDVTASGTIDVINSTVTGDITEGADVLEFPAINAQIHEDKAKLGGTYNENYTLDSGGPHELGPLYIDGDLSVADVDLALTGTVYVTGDVDINNTNVDGGGDIVTEGAFAINNYSLSVSISQVLPLFMAVTGNMSVNNDNHGGSSGTEVILYAPFGKIDMNNVELTGSVAADEVVLVNAVIHYPALLRGRADLPGAGLDTVTYLFE